jgi:hypothetical protein
MYWQTLRGEERREVEKCNWGPDIVYIGYEDARGL